MSRQLDRLIARSQYQRPRALRAKTAILARETKTLPSLANLGRHLESLPTGEIGYLKETSELRAKAERIAEWQRQADAAPSALIRHDRLEQALEAMAGFRGYVSGCAEPLASEFLRAAESWEANLRRQIDALPREVPDFFNPNLAVRAGMEAFVRRDDLLADLQQRLRNPAGGSGLLLYARRRMGKSTILQNLERLLPRELAAVYVSMQNAEAATSEAHFSAWLGEKLASLFPKADLTPIPADLAALARTLRRLQEYLDNSDCRVLIAIDEFEVIDERIGEGMMSERLLGMVRDCIQTHRQIRWLFSGVHHVSELPNARWSSYLTAFQQIEVRPFSAAETHQLLTEPLKFANAFGDRTPPQADFFVKNEFWAPGMIERIQHESQGWPALVQGIAKEVVAACNRRKVLQANDALLDEALDAVLTSVDGTLQELLLQQARQEPEKSASLFIRAFRTTEEQSPPAEDAVRQLLQRHELVVPTASGAWRLRVPLMQRWLEKKG